MAGINGVLARRAHVPNTILEKTLLIHEAEDGFVLLLTGGSGLVRCPSGKRCRCTALLGLALPIVPTRSGFDEPAVVGPDMTYCIVGD